MTETLAQWQREILVGALIDVNPSTWGHALYQLMEQHGSPEAVLQDDRGKLLFGMVSAMLTSLHAPDKETRQLGMRGYLKHVALMSDETLTWAVELAGANPLQVDQ